MRISQTIRTGLLLCGGIAPLSGCSWDRLIADRGPQPPPGAIVIEEPERTEPSDPKRLPLAYAQWQENIGNLPEARKTYEGVLGKDPNSVEALLGMARVDQLAGREVEAEEGFQRTLQACPEDPRVLDAAGQFYVAQERWSDAIPLLQQATVQAPNEVSYRFHLAIALARSGDINGSLPHFARTVGDAEAHYNVGYVLFEQGQLEAAEHHLFQALMKKPDLVEAQALYEQATTERENDLLVKASGPTSPVIGLHDAPLQTSLPGMGQTPSPSDPRREASAPAPNSLEASSIPEPSGGRLGREPRPSGAFDRATEPLTASPQIPSDPLPNITTSFDAPGGRMTGPDAASGLTREQWEQLQNQR